MGRLIAESRPKARKEYECLAYGVICNTGWTVDDLDLNEGELASIAQIEERGGKIQKGEVYVRQFCEQNGDHYSWIANIEMHQICLDHELYEE